MNSAAASSSALRRDELYPFRHEQQAKMILAMKKTNHPP
jgi:hypothetical protein